ncbi:MAG: virulence-associated protein E [Clostridia bacterium]|nr:virulence-associated protein E [Clostridia bacterium]
MLKNDRQITISTGNSRRDLTWKQTIMTVSDLYDRLRVPNRGNETYNEYLAMKKSEQDTLKDVGGFVGGALNGMRRKANSVIGRDIVTLDFDNIPGWQTQTVIDKVEELNCSYCVYSTRKHHASRPRLRVIVPLDRTVTPDEYEPCARRIASHIGISMADPTTFEVCRLMYWPSCCSDSDYVYQVKDAALISADFLLSTYVDWHDFLSWPQVPNAVSYQKLAMKQGDPLEKPGLVGAFCRTYDVVSAMETFLPKIYEAVDNSEDRYTYLGGSTTGGAIIYDDAKYLYSHHATDPCGGRLVNAFDLVRLHKYGDKDADSNPETPVTKLPSYKEMCNFALTDKSVVATLNREQHEAAIKDFEGFEQAAEDAPDDWAEKLQRNQNGAVKGTIDNILIILDGDPLLKDKFALNLFANRGEVLGPLPWQKDGKRRLWSDTDSNGLYWYLERMWGITQRGNIDSALDVHAAQHAFNEVQNYINSLVWDGERRLDTLFIDYLGAKDTAYNRAVCRKSFTAAIARAMIPGCKYDNMLILAGPQGIGKSTLLDKMSLGWFNDSIRTFEGKDASELLQGVWLVEVSELDAFRRTDVARIKQFLSLRADRYRAAYGRHVKELPRCCVFFGTTNTTDFLQDTTGNRRFWPVDVGEQPHTKNVWHDLTPETINQLWAEAKAYWQCGEDLYLTGNVEAEAKIKQEEHREVSVREGLIMEFAERQIPSDWAKWALDRRRDFWAGAAHSAEGNTVELVDRDRISAVEVWCELFNGSVRDMKPSDTREINAVLANMDGWKRSDTVLRFGPYNVQRGFVRR